MNIYIKIVSLVFISIGCVIMALAALGLYRFPDVYMRLHASTKINTGGAMSILFGLMVRVGLQLSMIKIGALLLLIFALTPVVSHAIARSAHLQGKVPSVPFLYHSKEKTDHSSFWRRKR